MINESLRESYVDGYEAFGTFNGITTRRCPSASLSRRAWDAGYDAAKEQHAWYVGMNQHKRMAIDAYPDPPAPLEKWVVVWPDGMTYCVWTHMADAEHTVLNNRGKNLRVVRMREVEES